MHPHLFPTIFPFFMVIIFILIHVPMSLCGDDEQYVNCTKSYQCANVNISYPFWGHDRPEYCGYPGFELDCQGDAPNIIIATRSYRVLDIHNTTQTLTVARADYWNDLCPRYLVNTTLDFSLFNYTPTTQNLTLNYGCPPTSMVKQAPQTQFTCVINQTDIISEYESAVCNYSVIVPAFKSAVQSLQFPTSANLIEALNGGFGLQWAANNTLCDRCAGSGGRCGHNLTSNGFTCYCRDRPYASQCNPNVKGDSSGLNLLTKIAAGISASVVGIIVVSIVIICGFKREHEMVFWKKETKNDQIVKAFIKNYGSLTPQRYSYSDVKKMTGSFVEKLGQGGYGGVYKGKRSDGRLVAVKVLSESKGNGEEFINEVASISRTSHVNVVTLLGFCYERSKRALIYEFMPNGSLDKFIYDEGSLNTNRSLEWKTLYQIAIGIAKGLGYLHQDCNTRILHFDVKPHNILLDEEFCPKVSDFGLAKLCQRKESNITMQGMRGTVGYIAPEVYSREYGAVSHKSDVYSYGMMVLEMVGGRKNINAKVSHTSEIYFPHWIYDHLKTGEELKLHGVMTEEEEEIARKMTLVSLWCIQTNPSDRPSMTKVVDMLEGSLQSLQIPPKPYLSSPTRRPLHSSITLSS